MAKTAKRKKKAVTNHKRSNSTKTQVGSEAVFSLSIGLVLGIILGISTNYLAAGVCLGIGVGAALGAIISLKKAQ